jgi:hypothetical protein
MKLKRGEGHPRASQVFGRRMREARESHPERLSRSQLAQRLTAAGFSSSERTIERTETGRREPGLDEALAIAWILGVAPSHMIVPFERPEPADTEAGLIFDAPEFLHVVDGIDMHPIEARAWISGSSLRQIGDEPLRAWLRFGYDEAPPPVRYGLEQSVDDAALRKSRFEVADTKRAKGGHLSPDDRRFLESFRGLPAPLFELVDAELKRRTRPKPTRSRHKEG